jgi:hypothetical protein
MKAHKFGIKKQVGHYECLIGGWKCICCSPSPKNRPKARRSVRRVLHLQDSELTKNYDDE